METGILVRFDLARVAKPRQLMLPQSPTTLGRLLQMPFVHGLRDTAPDHQHDLVNVSCSIRLEDVEPDYYYYYYY
jgi:hypothetical protein